MYGAKRALLLSLEGQSKSSPYDMMYNKGSIYQSYYRTLIANL